MTIHWKAVEQYLTVVNRHVLLRMVREVEMSRDWFRSVFIVNLNISKVFAETTTQSAARFADVYFLASVFESFTVANLPYRPCG